MTRKERTALESAITIRKERLDTANEVFGYDSTESWLVKNELDLLENLFKDSLSKPPRKYTYRKRKPRRWSKTNLKTMYLNKDGDMFVQLVNSGEYSMMKTTDEVSVEIFDYNIYGKLVRETNSGIVLTQWRIDHK